jgi:hypothetical protein
VLLLKAGSALGKEIGLGKDLQSGAFGADVVEEELAASRATDVDSASELDHLGLIGLAILEVGELVGKLADIVVDVELAG